ncbi:hypothetical protein Q6245_30225, partial [Klebsiella pneumoniae]|uniref:hypothetical protein n=1 Tax=Klebsiella pneumoniae TaxID=573 RepID=UPI002731D198
AELEATAKLTPAAVRDALAKWIKRPVFALTVVPGTRTGGGEARGGDPALPPAVAAPAVPATASATLADADRSKIPPA